MDSRDSNRSLDSLDQDISRTLGPSQHRRRPGTGQGRGKARVLRWPLNEDYHQNDREMTVESHVVRTANYVRASDDEIRPDRPPPPSSEAKKLMKPLPKLPMRGGGNSSPFTGQEDQKEVPQRWSFKRLSAARFARGSEDSGERRWSVRRLSSRLPSFSNVAGSRNSIFRRSILREGEKFAFDHPMEGIEEEEQVEVNGYDSVETGGGQRIKGGIEGGGSEKFHPPKTRHCFERVFIAFLAISLLWMTSYALARTVVLSFIETPEFSVVRNRNSLAYNEAVSRSQKYVECVDIAANSCEATYESELSAELDRVTRLKEQNADNIEDLNTTVILLEEIVNATLQDLNTVGTEINLADYVVDVGGEECNFVVGFVAGQSASLEALQAASSYQTEAKRAVQSREAQLAAREEYNRVYIANKTAEYRKMGENLVQAARNPKDTFQALNDGVKGIYNCFAPSEDGPVCKSGDPTVSRLSRSFQEVYGNYYDMKNTFETYKQETQDALKKFDDLRERLDDVKDSLGSALTSIFPSEGDTAEPIQLNNLNNLNVDEVKVNEIFEGSEKILNDALGKLNSMEGPETSKYEELQDNVQDTSHPLDDYNPPAVSNESVAAEAFETADDIFLDELRKNLELFSAISGREEDDEVILTNTSANLNVTGENFLVKLTNHSEWGFYVYSQDIVNQVDTGLNDLSTLLVRFDIAFRVLHTLFIIRKYWTLTGLSTPPGDARVKAMAGQGWGPKATPLQKVAAIITNPIVITTLFAATIGILVYTVWYAYSPLYYEYVDSCVYGDPELIDDGNLSGTMLYNNGYNVLYQYAASDGDKLAIKRVDDLNVGRNVECNQNSFDDTILYNNQAKLFNNLRDRLAQVRYEARVLSSCLNLNDLEDFNWEEIVTVLTSNGFIEENYKLEERMPDIRGIYNCSAVGKCAPIRTSEGASEGCTPNESVIKSTTFNAACTTENYVHSMFFGTFLIFAAYICMNIGRLLFMRGVVRLSWRHIISGPFSFLGSCTDRGQIVYPEVVSEKDIPMHEAIRLALKKRLIQWELWGLLILLSGIAINGPWIWAMTFLAENLSFEQ